MNHLVVVKVSFDVNEVERLLKKCDHHSGWDVEACELVALHVTLLAKHIC